MKAIDPSIRLQAMIEAIDWTCEDEALPLDEEYFRQVQETIARFYEEGRKTVSPTDIDIGLRYACYDCTFSYAMERPGLDTDASILTILRFGWDAEEGSYDIPCEPVRIPLPYRTFRSFSLSDFQSLVASFFLQDRDEAMGRLSPRLFREFRRIMLLHLNEGYTREEVLGAMEKAYAKTRNYLVKK